MSFDSENEGEDGGAVKFYINSEGHCYCPVCGDLARVKDWRPYSPEGYPLYDICGCCNFQFGYDDGGEAPYEKSWENYRESWLAGKVSGAMKMTLSQKQEQLKHIGL
ncbi:MAG: hypothetical protein ACFB10_08480 [Salibacteraceae bacterium]